MKHYHFELHILPPGLHKIGWTVRLECALLGGCGQLLQMQL